MAMYKKLFLISYILEFEVYLTSMNRNSLLAGMTYSRVLNISVGGNKHVGRKALKKIINV